MCKIKREHLRLIEELLTIATIIALFLMILGIFSCWSQEARSEEQLSWEFALDQKELAEPVDLQEILNKLGCETKEECADYFDELGCTTDASCVAIYGE